MQTEQKIWSNWSLRQQNYLTYPTFTEYFVITKICRSSCGGPLFVGAPVRPNMLNMPKSASVGERRIVCTTVAFAIQNQRYLWNEAV